MSSSQKRRIRRRRRVVRGFRKTFINLVFAPTRIPKITNDMVDLLMKLSEIAAMTFVVALIAHIIAPDVIATAVLVIIGGLFATMIALIKLSDYQEKIEQYRYYGFRI